MKKSSLIIVLLFGILSLVYSQSITFQMPEITNPADTIAVPISVVQCNLGCCEIGTFQIIVEYDPAVLSPISVLFPNSNFPFYEWMINMVYEPNKIAITWLSFTGSGNIQPPEVVCEVLFAYFGGCSDLLLSGGGGNCTYFLKMAVWDVIQALTPILLKHQMILIFGDKMIKLLCSQKNLLLEIFSSII